MKRPTENVKNAMNKMIGEYWQKPLTCTCYYKMLRGMRCAITYFEEFVEVRYGKYENGTPGVVIVGLRTGKHI